MTSHFLDNCATHLDLLQLDSRMIQGGKTIGDASMESYYAYVTLAIYNAARAKKFPTNPQCTIFFKYMCKTFTQTTKVELISVYMWKDICEINSRFL